MERLSFIPYPCASLLSFACAGKEFSLNHISRTLKIYGRPGLRPQLEPLLKWATPGQRGFTDALRAKTGYVGSSYPSTQAPAAISAPAYGSTSSASYYGAGFSLSQPVASQAATSNGGLTAAQREKLEKDREAYMKAEELKRVVNAFATVDDDTRRSGLLDTLCVTDDILDLPVHENPPSLETGELNTKLMKHQLQALKWMLAQEDPKLPQSPNDPAVQVRSRTRI